MFVGLFGVRFVARECDERCTSCMRFSTTPSAARSARMSPQQTKVCTALPGDHHAPIARRCGMQPKEMAL